MSEALEQMIRSLEARLAQLEREATAGREPWPRLFIAKRNTPGSPLWTEQTVENGNLVEFVGGRRSTVDPDPSNLTLVIKQAMGDADVLMEFEDFDGGNRVYRYIPVPNGLPPAVGRFKVLQLIDELSPGTWGVDYLRMAIDPADLG